MRILGVGRAFALGGLSSNTPFNSDRGLVATASAPRSPSDVASWPQTFFVGRTEGRGTQKKILSGPKSMTVNGMDRLDGAGTLVLDQSVEREGSKTKKREWRLVEDPVGRFRGTLTDATGRVSAILNRNDFHVRYRMKGAVDVDQHLLLQVGAQVILNQMVFRKFGVVVAYMNESIQRIR